MTISHYVDLLNRFDDILPYLTLPQLRAMHSKLFSQLPVKDQTKIRRQTARLRALVIQANTNAQKYR